MRLDLFCSVIDNFGDAGVCWRLARQLVAEEGFAVRLWIDRPAVLARLLPGFAAGQAVQRHQGVEIHHWHDDGDFSDPGEVVVEAFGCPLPPRILQAMAGRRTPPVWINLEYLSAEGWVDGCHGLPSPHPTLPLAKHYFFPGFTATTGGPLREAGLLARQAAFAANPQAAADLFRGLGVVLPTPHALTVSLFCYRDPALEALLAAWSAGPRPLLCLVPQPVADFLPAAYRLADSPPGAQSRHGALTLQVIPFLEQDRYDELLWSCDLNFVRGEDSFLRAQWAQRPFVWQAYRQPENAHHDKVGAFLDRYLAGAPATLANPLRQAFLAWNGVQPEPLDWPALLAALPAAATHTRSWAGQLAQLPGLAASLAQFARSRVK